MSCFCDYERPEIYKQKEVKAKKNHECCECGGTIKKGTHYTMTSGLWDSNFWNFKTCCFCTDLQNSLLASNRCISHGGLAYDYEEYLEDIRSDLNPNDVLKKNKEKLSCVK